MDIRSVTKIDGSSYCRHKILQTMWKPTRLFAIRSQGAENDEGMVQ